MEYRITTVDRLTGETCTDADICDRATYDALILDYEERGYGVRGYRINADDLQEEIYNNCDLEN